jgi:ATP-binding cassette subfamily B multidrug efflux pump
MQASASPPPAKTEDKRGSPLGRALRYLRLYAKLTSFTILAMLIATAAQLFVPQLVQWMIDLINVSDPTDEAIRTAAMQALLLAGLVIALAAIGRGLFAYGQTYLSQTLSQNIAFDLRNDIFSKIQRLSFSYHDKNRTGQLMVRATDDVERLRIFIGQGLILALQALLLMTGTLILLFATNVQLTLYILPILPVTLVLFMVFGRVAQPLFREVQKRLGRVNNSLQENLAGLRVVKAFAREQYERERFDISLESLLDQRLRINRTFSFLFPLVFVIANLGQAAVLYFGGVQIIEGSLTLGQWQKFSLYLIYLFFPLGQLGFIISLMAQASASAERIFEILDAQNDVENKPDAVELTAVEGYVTFEEVSFRYFSSSDLVLSHINFTAEPGQTIALLGSTGSGKSTIINLIPRFYDVSRGRVLVDGQDIRDVTIDSLRRHIGIVLQETNLFSGSIRENIAFGRPNATEDEIIAAAKAAAAHDFIMGFPQGYDTAVGERGSTLSGGQKQRLAIARALLLSPNILILDDSTSSVDLKTEYEIQQALDKLMHGRTSFVIAQRISTVLNADKILVLDKGHIVGEGTHEQLLETNAIYADIYYSQLMPDAEQTTPLPDPSETEEQTHV